MAAQNNSPDAELNRILQVAVKGGASDIHIKAGLPPIFRVDGSLLPLRDASRLSPEDIGRMAAAIMSKAQRELFQQSLDLDMSHGVPGVGRFRVNVFQQRGSIGMVFRVIPFKVKGVDELLLPPVVKTLAEERRGLLLVTGATGSGKSTMLQAVGLLEGGFGGTIVIAGQAAEKSDSKQRTTLRRDHLGFVYQFHHLLPDFNAIENVVLPQLVGGTSREAAEERAKELLIALGLGKRLEHRPSQLSGGEQQRVAVARALANKPKLVLADEPTGNLDEATSEKVLEQFLDLVRGQGSAALVATHNERLAAKMDRVVRLHEGLLE